MCPANKSSCWIVMLQVQVSTKPRRKDVTLPIMLIYVELSKDFRKNARTPAAQIGVKRLQAPRCLFNASQPGCKDHFPKGRKWDPSMWHYEMTWQQLGIIWNNYGMNDDILALLGTLIRSNQIWLRAVLQNKDRPEPHLSSFGPVADAAWNADVHEMRYGQLQCLLFLGLKLSCSSWWGSDPAPCRQASHFTREEKHLQMDVQLDKLVLCHASS